MNCCRIVGISSVFGRLFGGEVRSLAHLAHFRESAYRLLGAIFLCPDEDWLTTVPQVSEDLLEAGQPFRDFSFWGKWEALLASLKGLKGTDPQGLEAVYTENFLVSQEKGSALPYESAYLPRGDTAWVMVELEKAYSEDGFSLAPNFHDTPDHVTVELEFMGLLCRQEGEAWGRKALGEAVQRLDRERFFLARHLSQWFPKMAREVAGRDGDGLYAQAAVLAREFIAHDFDLIASLQGRFEEGAKS
jgi:TorA maturation chaperone TorD